MILENMIRKYISCFFVNYYFVTKKKMNHLGQVFHHHQMKLNESKGRKFVKFMEIENHDNARINDG